MASDQTAGGPPATTGGVPAAARDSSTQDGAERVVIHCDATSFDADSAELRTVAALRIRGPRILTSRSLVLSFWPTEPAEPAIERLLGFIGNRPLVGFYLDFTVTMLNRFVTPMRGAPISNPRVEVSSLYYSRKMKVPGKKAVDLRLDSILRDLDLPVRDGEDAESTALAVAMVCLRLDPTGR